MESTVEISPNSMRSRLNSVVSVASPPLHDTHFIWLEVTSHCQLECSHCYAASGPSQGHGGVSADQWMQVLAEAATAGVQHVQFIGGEPTSHPALPRLITHARQLGLSVEVFSNLFSIREHIWRAFALPGVSLATSYYSSSPYVHEQITQRVKSHERTRANIVEAVRRGIPVRVGLIRFSESQDVDIAIEELTSIGVDRSAISIDDQRRVGRGRGSFACTTENELCGKCSDGVLALMPDGTVQPCVFSRDERFKVGNIATETLTSILEGERLHRMREYLSSVFEQRGIKGVDLPQDQPRGLQNCGPACSPACSPVGNCNPVVNPPPCNPSAGHPPRPEPPTRPPGPVCAPY